MGRGQSTYLGTLSYIALYYGVHLPSCSSISSRLYHLLASAYGGWGMKSEEKEEPEPELEPEPVRILPISACKRPYLS